MKFFDQLSPHQWEYFASYYFSSLGYTILDWPSVGQDQGKDLMVQLDGLKSLVSCKHYSRSQRAVLPKDECSVLDKVIQHGAQQFIGFYSTRGSQALRDYLAENGVKYLIFEGDAILETMKNVSFAVHQSLFRNIQAIKPKIFGQPYRPLLCKCGCGSDLLNAEHALNSSVFLSSEGGRLNIMWFINGHGYANIKESSVVHNIEYCFSLMKLNEVIDEHDEVLNSSSIVSREFDKEYCLFLETIHQMVYPMD